MIPRLVPMLASAEPLVREDGYVHEIKWDGYRALAYVEGGQAELISRNGRNLTRHFLEIVPYLASLPRQPLVLDGELIALGKEGLPAFAHLRKGSSQRRTVAYAVFDLLYLSGENLCALPWLQRRTRLRALAVPQGPIFISPVFPGPLSHLLAKVKKLGLEGVVSKRIDSPYLPGVRSPAWRKTRIFRRDDFVVGGLKTGRGTVRAILVGQYCPKSGNLLYLGGVGSGLSKREREFFKAAQSKLAVSQPPFVNVPQWEDVAWLTPHLVVEVEYVEFTPSRRLRQPVLVRFRWDKLPWECIYKGETGGADGGN